MALLFPAEPDTLATTGADSMVRFWNTQTGKETAVIQIAPAGIAQAALLPGGKMLATIGTDFRIRLWNVPSGVLQATMTGHTGQIFYFAIDAAGQTATTASYDQTVRLWDLVAGTEIGVISGAAGWVSHAVAAPDGQTIATGHRNGAGKIWDAGTGRVKPLPGCLPSQLWRWPRMGALAMPGVAVKVGRRSGRDASRPRRSCCLGSRRPVRRSPAHLTLGRALNHSAGAMSTARRDAAFAADGKSVFTVGDDGACALDANLQMKSIRWPIAAAPGRSR